MVMNNFFFFCAPFQSVLSPWQRSFVYSLFKYAAEVTEVLYEQDFDFFHRDLKLLLNPVQ